MTAVQHKIPAFKLFYDKDLIAQIPMNASPFLIGRREGAHLRLSDLSVSRDHCRVVLNEKGSIVVEDLASTNGIVLDEQRIVKGEVSVNNAISIGRCTLVLTELDPEDLDSSRFRWLRWMTHRTHGVSLSAPRGKYVMPKNDMLTEFDSVAYSMAKDQAQAEGKNPSLETFFRQIPRLQVVARNPSKKEEVTRFSMAKSIFTKAEDQTLRMNDAPLTVFSQPPVRRRLLQIPWKWIERFVAPVALIVSAVFLGRYLLSSQIEGEIERANKHWDSKLATIAQRYQYASETEFDVTENPRVASAASQRSAISLDDVWKKIDAHPTLRDYLIFEVLDEFLASEEAKGSIDKVLSRVQELTSVTKRLPTVKKLQVVLASEALPIDFAGLSETRMVFLSDRSQKSAKRVSYADYKRDVSEQMAQISSCSTSRTAASAGRVVMGFTVSTVGKPNSVFINEARSTQESGLWACVRKRILTMKFEPPPGGPISILYTFVFSGPTKIQF